MRPFFYAFFSFILAQPLQAGDDDILRRMMSEPVTLFDWGMAQLDRDIAHTMQSILPRTANTGKTLTGSIYDWRAKQITVYAAIPLPRAQRTREACILTFSDIVASLTEGAPTGPNAAGWYLLNAFKPKAHFWGDRFEDVGAKLLNVVRLEITLIPVARNPLAGNTKRVRCTGRLNDSADELTFEETS